MAKETYQEFVSRCNVNSFFVKEGTKPAKIKRSKEREKVERSVANLTDDQLSMLQMLLSGEAVQLQIGGDPYVAVPGKEHWRIQANRAGSELHAVRADLTACSCQDCRLRGNECKHIKALKKLTGGGT